MTGNLRTMMSDEDLARRMNAKLVPDLRGQAIVVDFAEAVDTRLLEHLHRIRLQKELLDKGEAGFYRSKIANPLWFHRLKCQTCRKKMAKVGDDLYCCQTPRCAAMGNRIRKPRGRGITGIVVDPKWIERTEERTVSLASTSDLAPMSNQQQVWIPNAPSGQLVTTYTVKFTRRCVPLLDRRYDAAVVVAIYRTIEALADQMGWTLKGV